MTEADPIENPKDVYFVFAGFIDQLAVQKFFFVTTVAMQKGVERIHVLLQTVGGNVADGICLFNYFSVLPIELITYNVGSVSSAGVLAYLGGSKRVVAPVATFMVHRSHASLQGANSDTVQARIASLVMDDNRSEAVLKNHITFTPEQWRVHEAQELWLTAEDAIGCGLATEIGNFGPLIRSQVYNVLA